MEVIVDKKHTYTTQKSYNVAVVGDVHLMSANSSPRSRKDNYFLSTMSELDKIFKANDIILFLGDVFDTPVLAGRSLYHVFNLLKYYHKLGKKFYTIVGNHDIYAYNIESLPKTSLGLTFTVGFLKNHKRIMVHDVIFDGMPFKSKAEVVPRMEHSNTSILLGHYFYNFNLDPEYSLTDDMIKEMNYDYLLLGHDHKPYPEQQIGKTRLLRGGSIARNSADQFNLYRKPCYYQFVIDRSGISEINYIEIPDTKFGKEIFIDEVFNQNTDYTNDYSSITDVDDILKQFTKKSIVAKYTITDALSDLHAPNLNFDYIKDHYRQHNLLFV